VAIVFFQGRWLTPDVYTVPLGRCDVDWHVDRWSVAVACVGRDMIKVWPLPVERPQWEDAENGTAGVLALRSSLSLTRGGQDESATW
jgi:hypothetical protein